MRRRKNTRHTNIYWLVDTRTGVPFYCGKTVLTPQHRLLTHGYDARNGTTRVNLKVRDCGSNIRVDLIEVVPVGENWAAREKHWIAVLRAVNPDCCNTVDGGAGCPGRIASEKNRQRTAESNKARVWSEESRAKVRASMTGRKKSHETIEKQRNTMSGRTRSPEHCAAISAAKKGKPGKPLSAEQRAKISASNKGKKRTPETIARMRAAPNSGRFVAL